MSAALKRLLEAQSRASVVNVGGGGNCEPPALATTLVGKPAGDVGPTLAEPPAADLDPRHHRDLLAVDRRFAEMDEVREERAGRLALAGGRRQSPSLAPGQCPRCRVMPSMAAPRDVAIHDGRSTRRDCGRCGAFVEFVRWAGSGGEVGNASTAPVTTPNQE